MDLDEVVGRELYEMFRGDENVDDLPEWEDARDWDGWEYEYDENYNIVPFDIHAHWIAQGRRINDRITAWKTDQVDGEIVWH